MEEQTKLAEISAEVAGATLPDLERRVAALESALSELQTVAASASGRKTVVTAPTGDLRALDGALGSLSPEQRIAVKSQMMRSGLF